MVGKVYVEDGRYDAINDDGDIVPYHDVFPDNKTTWVGPLSVEQGRSELIREKREVEEEKVKLPAGQIAMDGSILMGVAGEFGEAPEIPEVAGATEIIETPEALEDDEDMEEPEPEQIVDRYPEYDDPPVSERLRFSTLTPELFKTMKIDDKRAFALMLRYEIRRGSLDVRVARGTGLAACASSWLDEEDNSAKYTPRATKLRRILKANKTQEDKLAYVELYEGKIKGELTQKARITWDRGYGIAFKNEYYDNEAEEDRKYNERAREAIDYVAP
ncbi:MAG: hypothetical protein LBK50_01235 [Candidatus Nomurabacteria bacterium]|jgi:hypothetical protein|nr:hypothetical protein [Candidatus Nomurabacteria bacterium]